MSITELRQAGRGLASCDAIELDVTALTCFSGIDMTVIDSMSRQLTQTKIIRETQERTESNT